MFEPKLHEATAEHGHVLHLSLFGAVPKEGGLTDHEKTSVTAIVSSFLHQKNWANRQENT